MNLDLLHLKTRFLSYIALLWTLSCTVLVHTFTHSLKITKKITVHFELLTLWRRQFLQHSNFCLTLSVFLETSKLKLQHSSIKVLKFDHMRLQFKQTSKLTFMLVCMCVSNMYNIIFRLHNNIKHRLYIKLFHEHVFSLK